MQTQPNPQLSTNPPPMPMQPQANRFRLLPSTALAALALFATTAPSHAQGLGGMLNQAKAKVTQTTSAPQRSAGPALAQATQGNTGPLPDAPSMSQLTVDNNIEFAQTVLANHRPWVKGQGTGDDDYYYRLLRDEYHAPLKFTWDRPYVEFITRQQTYLWFVMENVSEKIFDQYNPNIPAGRYNRAKMLKIKEWHFTTTTKRPNGEDRYAGAQGYVMSWNPATGVLTCAISIPGNVISAFRGEDITNFVNDNIK